MNEKGLRLVTVNTKRGTPDTQDPRLNTLSKLNCILACIEADKAGADEGIMLDINGKYSHQNRKQNLFLMTTPNCVFVAYFLPVILLFRLYQYVISF